MTDAKTITQRLQAAAHLLYLSIALCVSLLSGCGGSGRTHRETGGLTYSELVYSLYSDNETALPPKPKLVFPMTLAVAQIGETSPHAELLADLQSHPDFIEDIVEVPFVGDESMRNGSSALLADPQKRTAKFRERIQKVLILSEKLDADYLLMIGGHVESRTLSHPVEILDLAILPAFAVPSKKVKIEAKKCGAFISLETGDVVFLVNAMSKAEGTTSTVYRRQKRESLSIAQRDVLSEQIVEKLIARLKGLEQQGIGELEGSLVDPLTSQVPRG